MDLNPDSSTPSLPPLSFEQALKYLVTAVHIGQQRGAWNLKEASTLNHSVESIKAFIEANNKQVDNKQVDSRPASTTSNSPQLVTERVNKNEPFKPSGSDIKRVQENVKNKYKVPEQQNPQVLGLNNDDDGPLGAEVIV